MNNSSDIQPGHIPRRLSTDQPVNDFVAKDFVATGRTIDSKDYAVAPSQATPSVVDPRANAMELVPQRDCKPQTDGDIVNVILSRTVALLRSPDASLSAEDLLLLSGAHAVVKVLQNQIDNRLASTTATEPPDSKLQRRSKKSSQKA